MNNEFPLTIEEFKEKYKNDIENNNISSSMIFEFFDMLQENTASDAKAIRSQFERLFHYMLKYQYQPELQTKYCILAIRNARQELYDWSQSSKAIWRRTTNDNLQIFYDHARDITIENCVYNKQKELDNKLPVDIPSNWTKENLISISFIEDYIKEFANTSKNNIIDFLGY